MFLDAITVLHSDMPKTWRQCSCTWAITLEIVVSSSMSGNISWLMSMWFFGRIPFCQDWIHLDMQVTLGPARFIGNFEWVTNGIIVLVSCISPKGSLIFGGTAVAVGLLIDTSSSLLCQWSLALGSWILLHWRLAISFFWWVLRVAVFKLSW